MDTLYILGNGFDIAHGISTNYWNFREYLEERDWEFLYAFEKLYNIEPLDETEYGYSQEAQEKWNAAVKKTLWSEFENEMGNPSVQSMLYFSSSVLDDLDLETGNIGIRNTMDEYWKSEYGFINKLQDYVKDWISEVDISGVKPKCKQLLYNNESYYFNFNYTEILEKVYGIDRVLHIHGSINEDVNMPPFMGHCNKSEINMHIEAYRAADEAFDEGGASIEEAIADYLQAIYKDTGSYIAMNHAFFEKLKTVKNIIVIGWSAGQVDVPYLEMIRDSVDKEAKWTIYYYDKKAYDGLQIAFQNSNIINNFETEFLNSKEFWD